MAVRGTPIPWNMREAVQRLVSGGESQRKVAAQLDLARDTVSKYARKRPPSSLGQKD
jgi:predicted transcriptional regulator